MTLGPVWDFNIGFDAMDTGLSRRIPWDDWVMNGNQYFDEAEKWMIPFWWERLMMDPLFKQSLKTRWAALRTGVLDTQSLLGLVDDTAAELQENGAIDRNFARWGEGFDIDYEASIENLKRFLEERSAWMDEEISSM